MEKAKRTAGAIIEPLLLEGTHTREQIMAAITKERPELKSLTLAITKKFQAMEQAGQNPHLVEVDRPRHTATGQPIALLASRRKRRLDRLEQWAKETTDEVEAGFAKLKKFQSEVAAQPKARKVWP